MLEHLKQLAKIFGLKIDVEEGKEEAAIKAIADAADEFQKKSQLSRDEVGSLKETLSGLSDALQASKESKKTEGDTSTPSGVSAEDLSKQMDQAKQDMQEQTKKMLQEQRRQAEIEALGKKYNIKNDKYLNLFEAPEDGSLEESFKSFREENTDLFAAEKNPNLDNNNPGGTTEINTDGQKGRDLIHAHYASKGE